MIRGFHWTIQKVVTESPPPHDQTCGWICGLVRLRARLLEGLPHAASPRQLRSLFLYPTPTLLGTHVRDSSSFVLASPVFFLSVWCPAFTVCPVCFGCSVRMLSSQFSSRFVLPWRAGAAQSVQHTLILPINAAAIATHSLLMKRAVTSLCTDVAWV
jgi:hypothetical protein